LKWEKLGLVYGPDGSRVWAQNSALQPTPLLLNEDVIRVFVGFRDAGGVGRVGHVDVDSTDPSKVLAVSGQPDLDLGSPGRFDDNGVVPCAVVRRDDQLWLYYAGYQLQRKVKFTVFGGLAISRDGGERFHRYSEAPISDRKDGELLFRVAHSVLRDGQCWRIWYGAGSEFTRYGERSLPSYGVFTCESDDGIHWGPGRLCISVNPEEDVYRVGRPWVIRDPDGYRMFYFSSSKSQGFRMGFAVSSDGDSWVRSDDVGISRLARGWDSEMIA